MFSLISDVFGDVFVLVHDVFGSGGAVFGSVGA